MERRQKECLIRLAAGAALNVGLWIVYGGLTKWGGIEREFRWNFIAGCMAAASLVFVVPVFWKGSAWQAPVAFLLIAFPVVLLVLVLGALQRY